MGAHDRSLDNGGRILQVGRKNKGLDRLKLISMFWIAGICMFIISCLLCFAGEFYDKKRDDDY
jgi:hypothetical protein